MDIDTITKKIQHTKKYHAVYEKTIRRIVADAVKRYGVKRAEDKAKTLLHQIWGAYYPTRPDFTKLEKKLDEQIAAGQDKKEIATWLLSLQSSTKERLPILDTFYTTIFSQTGTPHTIIDVGCGLNPLSYFWMPLPDTTSYHAFDIDCEQMTFLSHACSLLHVDHMLHCVPRDIFVDTFPYADIIFLFKLLPPLLLQEKHMDAFLENLHCKYLVVTFPTTSIGGKQKGMIAFYSQLFENFVHLKGWQFQKDLFSSELVYIVER